MIIFFKYVLILILFLYCTPKFENSSDILNQDRLLEAIIFSSELLVSKQKRDCNNYHLDSNYEFKDNNDGTVIYIQSNNPPANCEKLKLIWKKCSQGQTYSNGACIGSPFQYINCENNDIAKCSLLGKLTSGPSFETCNSMKDRNWRIPNVKELYSLVYCSSGISQSFSYIFCSNGSVKPTINSTLFPNTYLGSYWTSEINGYYSIGVSMRTIEFETGSENGRYGNSTAYVRCIADD